MFAKSDHSIHLSDQYWISVAIYRYTVTKSSVQSIGDDTTSGFSAKLQTSS